MMMQLKVPHRPQRLTHKDVTHQLRQHIKLTELERWKSLETPSDVVRPIGGAVAPSWHAAALAARNTMCGSCYVSTDYVEVLPDRSRVITYKLCL